MRDTRCLPAAALGNNADGVEMEAAGAGRAAHQAPHKASEWEAATGPALRQAENRRRRAAAADGVCEWLRVGARRQAAAAGERLKACEECEGQVEVEAEEVQDRIYSWSP